jgi:superfamily II DNA/RNA helicase
LVPNDHIFILTPATKAVKGGAVKAEVSTLLARLKLARNKPTEIQARTIPLMMSGQSVVGVSETGSGKTLAYALPLLHHLKSFENAGDAVTAEATPRAVIIVPTRDLGEQVSKVLKTMTHDTRLRVRPALGGMTFEHSRRNVSGVFEVLLATPGRLIQLMDKNLIHLDDVRILIFDEADQMLDQGFLPDSDRIVAACPQERQLALFSATVSGSVQELMNKLFSNTEVIRSAGSGKIVSTLITKNIIVKDGKRWPFLERVLGEAVAGGTLIFTNTRDQCDKLAQELGDKGFHCAVYRGEMEKNVRRANLKKFREGKIDMLISTDLAARGLDLEGLGRVINYHLPQQIPWAPICIAVAHWLCRLCPCAFGRRGLWSCYCWWQPPPKLQPCSNLRRSTRRCCF